VVLDARTCKPLRDAAIDVWHCDAMGLYSGFTKHDPRGPGGPPVGPPPPSFDGQHPRARDGMGPPPKSHMTDQLTFLRGIQLTDEKGSVRFETIFPGFYMDRTNHIHFKVRVGGHAAGHTFKEGHTSHTGQIFFPEELTTKLMALPPYTEHRIHRTTQSEDGIFNDQSGELSIAQVVSRNTADPGAGFQAELIAIVDPTAPARQRMPWLAPSPGGIGEK
jgi:protocatechuate 3,4-dioxygenase beta subunit